MLKTNKAMAKRIKVTKNNKLIHRKAGVSHLLTNKGDSPKKIQYGKEVFEGQQRSVKNLIPYNLR